MSSKFESELRNFVGLTDTKGLESTRKQANDLALMSITVQKFIFIMIDEIEYAGITGLEMYSKSQLFLRSVTPSYSEKSFNDILITLEKIDEKFPKTRFYFGLTILRGLCTGQGKEFLDIIRQDKILSEHVHDLSFFTTYLIENIINYVKQLRKVPQNANLSFPKFKEKLEHQFDEIVLRTILSLSLPSANSAN